MADAKYVVLGSYPSVQVLSQTEVVPVQRTTIATRPHGTQAIVNVPLSVFEQGHAASHLAPVATNIETIWASEVISGAYPLQDTDPTSSLLTDYIAFVVSYTPRSGPPTPLTTTVRIATALLGAEAAFYQPEGGTAYGTALTDAFQRLETLAGR